MFRMFSPLPAAVAAALTVMSATGAFADDRAPKVDTSKPTAVVYPPNAQRAGEEGTVVVRVHVDEAGRPTDAAVARSCGHPDLDTAAIETALNWRYVPAIRGGAVRDDWAVVQVVYKLPDGQQPAASASR